MNQRIQLAVNGIVQGVGFRPFTYRLANELFLSGFVCNTSAGVLIEIEGTSENIERFCTRIARELPVSAHIDSLDRKSIAVKNDSGFVVSSSIEGINQTTISHDMAICPQCLKEFSECGNRRFKYPFISCVDCGPRFSTVNKMPYDRANTAMICFDMCYDCASEYNSPDNRRFHSEQNCCEKCGPQLFFSEAASIAKYKNSQGTVFDEDFITRDTNKCMEFACKAISDGFIVAVKGLGGYHLVCDAFNDDAVKRLRKLKKRPSKPFAVMVRDLPTAQGLVSISAEEHTLLESPARPIVLLLKKRHNFLSEHIAPGNQAIGILLPYTALHYLLLSKIPALVVTSGNKHDEPLVYQDEEAFLRLSGIADYFLWHNRSIINRIDDSVVMCEGKKTYILRCARGYAPLSLNMRKADVDIFAAGGEQKNTFALLSKGQAVLSQHIGNLGDPHAFNVYQREVSAMMELLSVKPIVAACDYHPDYHSTEYVRQCFDEKMIIPVWHHHAHMASVLEEHNRYENCIGVIFDGTGYGVDGNMWGGEFLLGDQSSFRRVAHLDYAQMPGAEKAVTNPWQMALSYGLESAGDDILSLFPNDDSLFFLTSRIKNQAFRPLTSGMGRLFDAAAVLICDSSRGESVTINRRMINYAGQMPIELENMIVPSNRAYSFAYIRQNGYDNRVDNYDPEAHSCGDGLVFTGLDTVSVDWRSLFEEIISDIKHNVPRGEMSAAFHNAIVNMVEYICRYIREVTDVNLVALSGGVWQNRYLLRRVISVLKEAGFRVITNNSVPCNDGGLAFGQVAVASATIKSLSKVQLN